MCGFYCIAFIENMLEAKKLLDYTNLLFRNDYKKNGKVSTLKTNMTKEYAGLEFRFKKNT